MGSMKDLLGDTPYVPKERAFDGSSYKSDRDYERLSGQLGKVFDLMKDGQWRTLAEIQGVVGGSEAGVSARLRDLRKYRNGSHLIEREHIADGLYKYRVSQ